MPIGTMVSDGDTAWIKQKWPDLPWAGTDGYRASNNRIDEVLTRAGALSYPPVSTGPDAADLAWARTSLGDDATEEELREAAEVRARVRARQGR